MGSISFLLAILDAEGRITALSISSEPPHALTRAFRKGSDGKSHPVTEIVTVCEAHASSYAEARADLRDVFESLFPVLSRRIPWDTFA